MNTRFQFKQCSARLPLVFCFTIALLLCPATTAQQLWPNPNYGTITVTTGEYAENLVNFDNEGTIENWGIIDNDGNIFNQSIGLIVNYEIIQNYNTLINYGGLYNPDYIYNAGLIANEGTIDSATTIDNVGTIRNSGIINNWLSATINNHGTLDNQDTIHNSGTLENRGAIDGEGTIYYSYITNAGTLDNQGTVDNTYFSVIHNLGTIQNDGYWNAVYGTFLNHGIFKGAGTFVGTLDTGDGIVAPGNSAGTMYVDGDYILGGIGTLEIEVGGFDAGEYDFLDITGTAFLTGGTLDFSFLPGYDISLDIGYGESLSLMFLEADLGIDSFASSISYDFLGTPAGFLYDVYQQDSSMWFSATNTNSDPGPGPGPGPVEIPAPGALALAGIGAGLVNWLRRRRVL